MVLGVRLKGSEADVAQVVRDGVRDEHEARVEGDLAVVPQMRGDLEDFSPNAGVAARENTFREQPVVQQNVVQGAHVAGVHGKADIGVHHLDHFGEVREIGQRYGFLADAPRAHRDEVAHVAQLMDGLRVQRQVLVKHLRR